MWNSLSPRRQSFQPLNVVSMVQITARASLTNMLFGVPVWIRLFIQALSFGYKQAVVKCSACSEVLSLHIRLNDFTGVLNWSCDILDLSSNLITIIRISQCLSRTF
ncbi:uncharacterized protein BJ212DRAFT_512284 [Suillus subaureus]|uniref:Uncharacterized protein n=1 Tax=Suillus subaureus TaxID=48587 RepID=A0A9P7JAV3_9AGAM|nr:uncharacterized protein BJ212DRAFT_512284 [Suillus subaureus]KAG1811475.1 hypothetical protein BJ212DRAFT_512284 [Suillus subaureus]